MSKYLFIESRDPFEFKDVAQSWNLATSLGEAGHDVVYFLVQNGVLAARSGAKVETLGSAQNVTVMADDVSLAERAINRQRLREGVEVAGAERLVELTLDDGRKSVWM